MAKKKKIDVEIQVNDASLEIKKDETINEVKLDTYYYTDVNSNK